MSFIAGMLPHWHGAAPLAPWGARIHENHEVEIKVPWWAPACRHGHTGCVVRLCRARQPKWTEKSVAGWCLQLINRRNLHMKWVTPAAVVLRFGMEINSYIANR